eukprot:gene25993-32510_t
MAGDSWVTSWIGGFGARITPVRDSSRSCLFNIQKRVNDQHNFVFKLIFLVNSVLKSNNNTSTESATLTLDGILGCLIDSFQEFPDLIIQFDVPITLSCNSGGALDGDSPHNRINQPTVEFVETIQLCMGHVASSVRQKASQVLTIILKNLMFLPGDDISGADMTAISRTSSDELSAQFANALFDYIASKVLMESLQSQVHDDWRLQEVCLMVVEDMLRGVLQSVLKRSGDTKDTIFLESVDMQNVILRLVIFLKDSLCLVLCHVSFEVRRMATQLLPLLARVAVVLNCADTCAVIALIVPHLPHVEESRSIDDLDAPLIHATYSSDSAGGHPSERVVTFNVGTLQVSNTSMISAANRSSAQDQLLTLTNVTWLAELLKQNQHLLEALVPCSVSTTFASPLENWSLEGPGRLFEMEHRVRFQKDIRTAIATMGESADCSLLDRLISNCEAILGMISELLLSFQFMFTEPLVAKSRSMDESDYGGEHPLTLLTGDCIECVTLILAFLVNVQARFTEDMAQERPAVSVVLTLAATLSIRCKTIFAGWLRRVCLVHSLGESAVSRTINMNVADSNTPVKNKTPARITTSTSALLELLSGSDFCASLDVTFIPSLTDPAINPGAFFDTHEDVPRTSHSHNHNASMYSKPNTPSHSRGLQHSNTMTFGTSPHSTFTRSASSPVTSSTRPSLLPASTGGGSQHSHSAFGQHRYSINNTSGVMGCSAYQSMDRWNCEVVSPLLGCLVRLEMDKDAALMLCVVLIEWILSCSRNSLWLDGKAFSKKNLFEAFNVVITSLQHLDDEEVKQSDEEVCVLSSAQTFHVSVQILRALAEVLSLKQQSKAADLKHVVSLLRSSNALSSIVQTQIQSHKDGPDRLSVDDNLVTDAHVLLVETTGMLSQSAEHFTEQYNNRELSTQSPHSNKERPFSFSSHTTHGNSLYASLKSLMVSGGSPGKPKISDSAVVNTNSVDEGDIEVEVDVEEDEFSDWDDDEDDLNAETGPSDFSSHHIDPLMCTQESVTLSVDANRGVLLSTLGVEIALLQKNCVLLTELRTV